MKETLINPIIKNERYAKSLLKTIEKLEEIESVTKPTMSDVVVCWNQENPDQPAAGVSVILRHESGKWAGMGQGSETVDDYLEDYEVNGSKSVVNVTSIIALHFFRTYTTSQVVRGEEDKGFIDLTNKIQPNGCDGSWYGLKDATGEFMQESSMIDNYHECEIYRDLAKFRENYSEHFQSLISVN